MKRCPNCNQGFDDGYDFCLHDGSLLVAEASSQRVGGYRASGEMPTQVIPRPRNTEYPQPATTSSSSAWVFPLVGVLCGLVVILGYFAFFREPSTANPVITQKSTETREPINSAETRPTRQLETTPVPPPPPPPPPASTNQPGYPVVTVNSPRDGYLALKSEACIAPCGTTLIKIPHGTRLSLGTCKDNFEVADRRRGRWCYTTYTGYTGWVFDAFVTR